MDSIAVVVGRGPNAIEIPLLWFPDEAHAEAHLAGLGISIRGREGTWVTWAGRELELSEALREESFTAPAGTEEASRILALPNITESCNYMPVMGTELQTWVSVGIPGLRAGLFRDGDYADGCGGVGALEIRVVPFGQPMVGWDLD